MSDAREFAPFEDDDVRAAQLHAVLREWLAERFPGESLLLVATALTYELARIVALGGQDLDDAGVETLLLVTMDTMRRQIAAHRSGRLGLDE